MEADLHFDVERPGILTRRRGRRLQLEVSLEIARKKAAQVPGMAARRGKVDGRGRECEGRA